MWGGSAALPISRVFRVNGPVNRLRYHADHIIGPVENTHVPKAQDLITAKLQEHGSPLILGNLPCVVSTISFNDEAGTL